MFVIGNLFIAVANILSFLLWAYQMILIGRILISWVSPDPYNPIVQFLYRATDPVLEPVRRFLPAVGPVDFSPMIVFLLIMFLKGFLVQSLIDLGYRMKYSMAVSVYEIIASVSGSHIL